SNVATEVSATSPPVQVPAVWTAPQSGPNFATAASYAFSTCASSVTSATARSMPNTFAPSRSSRAETTAPRFPDAPVTTPPRQARRKIVLLAFVAVPINQGFFLYGLQLSTAAHAALLYTLTPLFVLLLAQALIGEFPGWRTTVGAALALGGTVYVLLHRGLDLSRGTLAGDLLLLVAVVAWSLYPAEGRELVARFGSLPTIAWTLIAGTLLFLPLGLGSLLLPVNRADL